MLAEDVEEREGEGRTESRCHAEAIQGEALPDLRDEGQSDDREEQPDPDGAFHGLASTEAHPQHDPDGRGELDDEGDPDWHALDRHEVEELRHGDADDAVGKQELPLVAADPQRARPRDGDDDEEDGEGAHGAGLGECRGRDTAQQD